MLIALTLWSALFTAPDKPGQPCLAVRAIVAADLTVEARLQALLPLVGVGKTSEDAHRALGKSAFRIGIGPGFGTLVYFLPGGEVVRIGCDPGGEIHSITLKAADGRAATQRSKQPVTWSESTGKSDVEPRR